MFVQIVGKDFAGRGVFRADHRHEAFIFKAGSGCRNGGLADRKIASVF